METQLNYENRTEKTPVKKCNKCKRIFPIENYAIIDKVKNWRRGICIRCYNEYSNEYNNKRKENNICIKCGLISREGYMMCLKCSKKETARIKEKRRSNKIKAVEYKDGKCEKCGIKSKYMCIYEFHHIEDKDFTIARYLHNRSWDIIKKELDKCKLVCSNCHRIIHLGVENE